MTATTPSVSPFARTSAFDEWAVSSGRDMSVSRLFLAAGGGGPTYNATHGTLC